MHLLANINPTPGDNSHLVGRVHHAEALTLMRGIADASIDLIATDPPYFAVKDEAWDNQWGNRQAFLDWLELHVIEMVRILKPNGSLYLSASPRLGSHVEITLEKHLNIINRITWKKPAYSTKAEMSDKDMMRGYFPASEVIIFAEPYGKEQALKDSMFVPILDYLTTQLNSSGLSLSDLQNKTGWKDTKLNHYFRGGIDWWRMPTEESYQTLCEFLPLKPYKQLLTQYEDLRREYEDLRRPFNVTKAHQYTDVWTYRTVNTYPGKHPTEKPMALMSQIIEVSSKPDSIVLDPFCGSGTTLDAARQLGRQFIGGDMDVHWSQYARNRVSLPFTLNMFADADAS